MSTLAAGSSTTVPLAAGQELYFPAGGAGVAVVASGQMAGQPYQLGSSRVQIGPFTQATSVSVSASAALSYFVLGDNPATEPPSGGVVQDPGTGQQYANGSLVSGYGNTSTPSGYYHLAYRSAQAGNGPLIDQTVNMRDAAPNTYVFPSGWTASQAVALGAYRSPTNPNAAAFAAGLPLYKCTTAGNTGTTEPNWNTTIGGTTADNAGGGTAVWTAEKGPWYTDTGGVRQFRSLLDTQLGSTTAELGAYNLGVLPWDLANGDSLIISITSLQNYTSGPTNFNETAVAGNRIAGSASAGVSLIATGQTTFNDLRLRISDGTTTRNIAHLDSGGVAQSRAGDGSRRTTTFFVDGKTKRMYVCADGVPRTAVNNYSGVDATNLVGWEADISAITGSTSAGTRPFMFGTQPNADGSMNSTTYELGASRLDILVLPGRGLPELGPIASWFHNRGEGLLPSSLLV